MWCGSAKGLAGWHRWGSHESHSAHYHVWYGYHMSFETMACKGGMRVVFCGARAGLGALTIAAIAGFVNSGPALRYALCGLQHSSFLSLSFAAPPWDFIPR